MGATHTLHEDDLHALNWPEGACHGWNRISPSTAPGNGRLQGLTSLRFDVSHRLAQTVP